MGWFKDMFGEGSSDPNYWDKKFKERMAKEQKENDEIFDMSKNIDQINERRENDAIAYRKSQNAKLNQEVREERRKEEKAADGLKFVIDTAKLQCDLCTNPIGDLKVNFDTPSIQGKKTATVKEKDMKSLIFKGNCTKSPQSSSPCASVMQLGDWKDVGNMKVQEQFPLLLKSTIPCNYGGTDIKITDCGQRNEPTDIETMPMGLKKEKLLLRGWWSSDANGYQDITEALLGDHVYFHIKTKNIPGGEEKQMKLYDDDNNEKDEPKEKGKDNDDYKKMIGNPNQPRNHNRNCVGQQNRGINTIRKL